MKDVGGLKNFFEQKRNITAAADSAFPSLGIKETADSARWGTALVMLTAPT